MKTMLWPGRLSACLPVCYVLWYFSYLQCWAMAHIHIYADNIPTFAFFEPN